MIRAPYPHQMRSLVIILEGLNEIERRLNEQLPDHQDDIFRVGNWVPLFYTGDDEATELWAVTELDNEWSVTDQGPS